MRFPKVNPPSYRCFNIPRKEVVYCYKGVSPNTAFVCTADSWGFYPISNLGIEVNSCLGNPQDSFLSKGSGFKDRFGIEVYQYDIVRDLSCEFSVGNEKAFLCGEVYFKDGVFRESYFNQPIHIYKQLEVIGNRFETESELEHCPPPPKGYNVYEG